MRGYFLGTLVLFRDKNGAFFQKKNPSLEQTFSVKFKGRIFFFKKAPFYPAVAHMIDIASLGAINTLVSNHPSIISCRE